MIRIIIEVDESELPNWLPDDKVQRLCDDIEVLGQNFSERVKELRDALEEEMAEKYGDNVIPLPKAMQ